MFFKLLTESIKDKAGKISSSRFASYIILIPIIVGALTFIGIDIVNTIAAFKKGAFYTIPFEHITLYGLMLGHHLGLLGIKNSNDGKMLNAGMFESVKVETEAAKAKTEAPKKADESAEVSLDEESMDSDSTGK